MTTYIIPVASPEEIARGYVELPVFDATEGYVVPTDPADNTGCEGCE